MGQGDRSTPLGLGTATGQALLLQPHLDTFKSTLPLSRLPLAVRELSHYPTRGGHVTEAAAFQTHKQERV